MDFFEEGKLVDVIIVVERLRERGIFDVVGGNEYLINFVINILIIVNVIYYVKIVEEKLLFRKFINFLMKIIEKCKS